MLRLLIYIDWTVSGKWAGRAQGEGGGGVYVVM